MIFVPQLLTLSVSISRIVVVINFVYERLCMWLKLCEGYFFFFFFFLFLSCMTIVNMFLYPLKIKSIIILLFYSLNAEFDGWMDHG